MKIAQVAPIIERVPPKKYGGTERVVSALTEELVKKGHQVTLFASGDSITSAKLISVHPRSLRDAKMDDIYGSNCFTMLNIGLAYSMQDKFDIIHDHNTPLSLPTANLSQTPVVMTMHGPITATNKPLMTYMNKPNLVSISHSQQAMSENLNWINTVYNGLNMDHYPFSKTNKGYLLFVGRISMEKGVHHAIQVAQFLDLPLIIAAKLDAADMAYFQEYVGPKLSDQIKWVGEVDEVERNKLMSEAKCMLHPVTWREPFGLTLIEAMACGCPVIGFNKGSIPEIIKNGKTGFVIEDADQMTEAVLNIGLIDRSECRNYSLENFNAGKMAESYEKVYRKLLEKSKQQFSPIFAHQIEFPEQS